MEEREKKGEEKVKGVYAPWASSEASWNLVQATNRESLMRRTSYDR